MTIKKTLMSTMTAATLVLAAQQPAAAQGSSAQDALGVEEIVVTARRREESILETPLAITAVTGADLEKKGITSFNQLAEATAGVNISNASAGAGRSDRSFQQITLRGMVPSSSSSTLTATFIDGVPVASPSAIASVNDPARIEILKGPQAAYFGRNTFAGAINVVNKQPGDVLGGSMLLMGGTRSNIDLNASIDGPIVDERFGFRANVRYFAKDGSYKNGANPSETLGDQQTQQVSLLLTAKPTENFAAKLYLLHSEDDDGASAQGYVSAAEVRAVNGVVSVPSQGGSTAGTLLIPDSSNCSILGYAAGRDPNEARVSRRYFCGAVPGLPAGFPAQNTFEDSLLAASLANPRQRVVSPSDGADGYGLVRQYQHAHLNLDYTFGESGFTLSSLSGLNAEYYSEVADLDNYDTRLLNNPSNPGNANPGRRTFWDFPFGVERETYDFSQEVRLAYDKEGAFSGVVGVSYLKTTVWNNLINISSEALAGASRDALTSAGKSPVETKGVFFGTTYQFTDDLKVSFEGRYQQDYVQGLTTSAPMGTVVGPATAATFGIPAGSYGPLSKLVDATYKNFLPRLIVSYDFNDDWMGYASFSKGVNVGTNTFNTAFLALSSLGIQNAVDLGLSVVQQPEKLTNYELGLKGVFLDGRATLQAGAYFATWTDQLNNRSRTFNDLPVSQGGIGTVQQVSGFANTGETDLRGLELEGTAKFGNLDLNFSAAMNESDIQSFSNPLVSQLSGVIGDGFEGNQLPLASKYSMNLGAQYGTAISAWDDASWFARADVSWKDKQYLNAANLTWIKARTVVNLRAGVTRGALSVDAYVTNLFDDDNYVAGFQGSVLTPTFSLTGVENYAILGLPDLRVYGARVGYKF
jgi:iron complex outermembrane receptor protein